MEKFYDILGVKKTATDEEVKRAYVNLKRKYDESSYEKEELKERAREETKKIMEAFDAIMNERRTSRMRGEKKEEHSEEFVRDEFKNIEDLIEEKKLNRAEEILLAVPQEKRTARWYFLRGVVLFNKGWLLEAYNFFVTANRMDPENEEYKRALEKASWQRSGGFNNPQYGQDQNQYPGGMPANCSFCDVCGAVMCADMCCQCGAPRPYRGFC